VLKRCVAAKPNRGELWLSVAKSTQYRRSDIGTILKKVVEKILAKGIVASSSSAGASRATAAAGSVESKDGEAMDVSTTA